MSDMILSECWSEVKVEGYLEGVREIREIRREEIKK